MQTFEPADIKYTYSPDHDPIGAVEGGEPFAVITVDGFTGRYDDPADFTPETAQWVEENLDGVTGPIMVEGAQPGQAVAITIEELEVATDPVVVVSRCQARSPHDWWHEEDHVVKLTVSDGGIRLRDDWTVPVTPLIGCLATSPARETVFSKHEGDHGGNLDVREITAGSTIVLPVEVPGAGLYFGDCKAALGDGEIVCAPECGTRIVVTARPFERPSAMLSPRILTADRLMTVVSAPSLTDAARSAFRALKLWLEQELELTSDEAAMVMGIGAHCGIGQVSNLLHTAKCSIDRSLLPPDAREPDMPGDPRR
ncbi:MAG: acetamidase/formamidase family protein [Actinobacteria bacterium]|nr:acetamidase/formamidase family protein [Actinomycetota bacterium]